MVEKVSHYQLNQSIAVSGQYVFYSATDLNDQKEYIIKTVSANAKDIARSQLQHEYALINRLSHYNHFPRIHEFDHHIPGIVFLDEGLQPLATLYGGKKMPLNEFLPFAIIAARALAEVHQENIIHKDLNLHTIFYSPESGALQIGGFAIASELMRTMIPGDPPHLLQGQLAYMSPEQTGRSNRPLSMRSDLYSLGIVFYELLLGHLPFSHADPMVMIIDHLNTIPLSPYAGDQSIPETLSKIVMKLLEKKSEDRYKGALGLADDLELAWISFKDKGVISDFPLGQKDVPIQLQLPDKIYGRESETIQLQDAFSLMVSQKRSTLISISGYSGIGKSSLVNELAKSIALNAGFFAQGKFDKFQQSDSYQGLRDALDKLVRYQLSLSEGESQSFKNAIITELGTILPIMVDFIPSLKEIMGELAALPEVGIEETKNRFQLAMLRFFKALTQIHPMVLFLDDLQWANTALLEIIEKLLLAKEINHLLILISYRSNEVNEQHPLSLMLERLFQKTQVNSLKLEGLNEEATNEMLQDMLGLPSHQTLSLSTLLFKKTEGNPFFLLMILEELYKEGALCFSKDRHRWVWQEAEIVNISATENVVAFVERRLKKLPEETKVILHLAACVGGTFSLEALSHMHLGDIHFLAESLNPAMKAGLLIPINLENEWNEGLSDGTLLQREYRFQHDRIQQSAYELKSIEETKKIQLTLARNWYQTYQNNISDSKLLAIVDQFNKGLTYVSLQDEKNLIGQLNYNASQIALQSIAYEVAYEYATTSKQLLNENDWDADYSYCFKVYSNFIECSFLTHHYVESNAASEIAVEKANNTLDKVKVLALKGNLDRAVGKKLDLDNNYFSQGLSLLGYQKIVQKPHLLEVILAVLRYQYNLRFHHQTLAEIKTASSEEQKLIFSLLIHLAEECFYAGDLPRYVYCLATWCTQSYSKQDIVLRAAVYGIYSILWPYSPFSHRLYLEAYQAIGDDKVTEQTAAFIFANTVFHLPWHAPWSEVVTALERSMHLCEKVGNLEFLGYSLVYKMLYKNSSCQEVIHYYRNLSSMMSDISPRVAVLLKIFRQYYFSITNEKAAQSWQDDFFDVSAVEKLIQDNNYDVGYNVLSIYRSYSYIHFNKIENHLNALNDLEKKFNNILSSHNTVDIATVCMAMAVLMVETYHSNSLPQKLMVRLRLYRIERLMKKWHALCPENFKHRHLAIQAERARLKGNFEEALVLYTKASEKAVTEESWECAALFNHRALTLCVAYHEEALIRKYAKLTLRFYEKWQATAVVNYIKKEYAQWLSL